MRVLITNIPFIFPFCALYHGRFQTINICSQDNAEYLVTNWVSLVNCDLCKQRKVHTWDHVSECHISRDVHNQCLVECKCFRKRIVRVKMKVDEVGKKAIYAQICKIHFLVCFGSRWIPAQQ